VISGEEPTGHWRAREPGGSPRFFGGCTLDSSVSVSLSAVTDWASVWPLQRLAMARTGAMSFFI
jgi:hypothetical protein